MSDEADQANDNIERDESIAIKKASFYKGPKATGFCLYCNAEINKTNLRWCDAECRDHWQNKRSRFNHE